MKMETEITVLVNSDYETLKRQLEKKNFKIVDEYQVNDIYMIDKNIDLNKLNNLEILKKCVLVRDIVDIKKVLLYKYKKYADNGDIIEQGKVECPITDVDKAVSFMETINYRTLFKIYDKCIVYTNGETELVVQLVNDEYIFIEMEAECSNIDKVYKDATEMKDEINKYNLPIDNSNYFVKKAEIELEKVLKKEKK